jgi:predicted nucleic acid-binding protein
VKVLFDTSVLLAALVEGHPRHEMAWAWLEDVIEDRTEGGLCTHTLAELYATLTVLPSLKPRPAPHEVVELLARSVLPRFRCIALGPADYEATVRRCADRGLRGGAVYDALIEQAARHWGAEVVLSLNPRDFRLLEDERSPRLVDPAEEDPPGGRSRG